MPPEPRQILLMLSSGQITLSDAEHLLESTERRATLSRLHRWISSRLSYAIAVAVLAGMLLQPAVLLAAQTAVNAFTGSEFLQQLFHRLLEAML